MPWRRLSSCPGNAILRLYDPSETPATSASGGRAPAAAFRTLSGLEELIDIYEHSTPHGPTGSNVVWLDVELQAPNERGFRCCRGALDGLVTTRRAWAREQRAARALLRARARALRRLLREGAAAAAQLRTRVDAARAAAGRPPVNDIEVEADSDADADDDTSVSRISSAASESDNAENLLGDFHAHAYPLTYARVRGSRAAASAGAGAGAGVDAAGSNASAHGRGVQWQSQLQLASLPSQQHHHHCSSLFAALRADYQSIFDNVLVVNNENSHVITSSGAGTTATAAAAAELHPGLTPAAADAAAAAAAACPHGDTAAVSRAATLASSAAASFTPQPLGMGSLYSMFQTIISQRGGSAESVAATTAAASEALTRGAVLARRAIAALRVTADTLPGPAATTTAVGAPSSVTLTDANGADDAAARAAAAAAASLVQRQQDADAAAVGALAAWARVQRGWSRDAIATVVAEAAEGADGLARPEAAVAAATAAQARPDQRALTGGASAGAGAKAPHYRVCSEHDVFGGVCKMFGVHPLTIEDVLTVNDREKMEVFDSYLFLVIKAMRGQRTADDLDGSSDTTDTESESDSEEIRGGRGNGNGNGNGGGGRAAPKGDRAALAAAARAVETARSHSVAPRQRRDASDGDEEDEDEDESEASSTGSAGGDGDEDEEEDVDELFRRGMSAVFGDVEAQRKARERRKRHRKRARQLERRWIVRSAAREALKGRNDDSSDDETRRLRVQAAMKIDLSGGESSESSDDVYTTIEEDTEDSGDDEDPANAAGKPTQQQQQQQQRGRTQQHQPRLRLPADGARAGSDAHTDSEADNIDALTSGSAAAGTADPAAVRLDILRERPRHAERVAGLRSPGTLHKPPAGPTHTHAHARAQAHAPARNGAGTIIRTRTGSVRLLRVRKLVKHRKASSKSRRSGWTIEDDHGTFLLFSLRL
jgi:hypothetical protein